MILLLIFVLGVILVVAGVLLTCFPKALDELSNITSQAIVNMESKVIRHRVPFGVMTFVLGILLMWISQRSKF